MGGLLTALVLLLIAAAPAWGSEATITAEKSLGPRVVELTISTPAFTAPTHVDVDLPNGYELEPQRRWPVAYFLAGTQNTYASFNSVVDGVGLTESFPAIVVSPNGNSGYWSDWYNGGKFGPPEYETYVVEQLIPLIDERFRTLGDRAHRAIAGVSMGGYGAMMIAARHPDLFADAASISGADDSNVPELGAAVSLSSTFDGGAIDAIYGPRLTQEVRWRGHNPTDLAANLRGLDLQVRTANGILDPGIGEELLSADTVSCLVEAAVFQGSTSFSAKLDKLGIAHLWKNYGPGCHSPQNFEREIADTLTVFTEEFADPPAAPSSFDYESIEPSFDIWGWHVAADPKRALEFMRLENVGDEGMTIEGSGTTTVTSPPLFRHAHVVHLTGATTPTATPDAAGRITFQVDLGPPDRVQQYRLGADPAEVTKVVTYSRHRPAARVP
ncbi:MAG: alpha/beta hydrolase family protein [Solirubrobacterales bacterium]